MATTSAAPAGKGLQIDQIAIDPPAQVPVQASIDPETQKRLYHETDLRFQAKTGVVKKIDPHNPIDQILIPAWNRIYGQVLAEFKSGKIHWTSDHAPMVKAIADASTQTKSAIDKLAQAIAEPAKLAEHAGAAKKSLDASAIANKRAGAMAPADPHLAKLLTDLDFGSALAWIASGKATPADAVTVMQAQDASDHAKAVDQIAPPSSVETAPPATASAPSGERGRPMPWGAFLGVCGAFGAVLAISSAKR
jgi:hypothetical protein